MSSDPDRPLVAPQRSDHRSGNGRRCRWGRPTRAFAARSLVVAGLLALTSWGVSRSHELCEAEAAYRNGDLVTALRRALDHLDHRPRDRPAVRLVALCLSRLDFADSAESYYCRAGRLGLEDLHVRAYGLVRGNCRLKAETAYRQILAKWPGDSQALRRLGAELMTMMRWDEAIDVARRLARTLGGEVDGLAMMAAIQHYDNKEEAIVTYQRLFEIDPELRRLPSAPEFRQIFWAQLAEDFLAVGQTENALRLLERAPPADRGPIWTWLVGRAYCLDGRFDEAERRWREAVQKDSKMTDAWIELGRLALARNRPEEAIAPLERASELVPRAYMPSYLLSLTYRLTGQVDLADRHRARAERFRGESPPASGSNVRDTSTNLQATRRCDDP
jgi:tetratricopeptide (TPR) repeat protein